MLRKLRFATLFSLTLSAAPAMVGGQAPAGPTPPNSEWRTYGGDLRSTRYMPLDQINRDNFSKLAVAWRLKTDSLGPRPNSTSRSRRS